ncbi:MAG TPA: anthranilate synthase component I [Hyphomicrobiales bacterium]|nr:anthranilate synthase component I [Hyphomicrobiales bacterium]
MQIDPKSTHRYRSRGGIDIFRASMAADYADAARELRQTLDTSPGVLLSSSFEAPGRYTRWDVGFAHPPLRLTARGRAIALQALNARGEVLLRLLAPVLEPCADLEDVQRESTCLRFSVRAAEPVLLEETRTRQRSVFSVLRLLVDHFASGEDSYLGLYGAFGYDLVFQFETLRRRLPRAMAARDLVLYLPDAILVVDHKRELAQRHYYDFEQTLGNERLSTRYLPRRVAAAPFVPAKAADAPTCDHATGEYAALVERALGCFRRGDLFEVVPSQVIGTACTQAPSQLFQRLQQQNPAPYGALLNLGEGEFLVSASPEMYVRVAGKRVETCPISGTIRRGGDALADADQIRRLLDSAKDEAELTMCTDVDRNDKARLCEPGSIRVLGRRQVELYSRLIHTVDHVEGRLLPEFDALDAFLSHAWAVTVSGAPKPAALQFIEDHEKSPRRWYGGALGALLFNGDINTGLTIRSIRLQQGRAEVRVGATLLASSIPQEEEAETRLKAEALLAALGSEPATLASAPQGAAMMLPAATVNLDVLMVDHRDSFVHSLASQLRECGARVRTLRPEHVPQALAERRPDLVVLSPGPGRPAEQGVLQTLALCEQAQVAVFGVCLGLQGMVEYFGGTLATLAQPMHGVASVLRDYEGALFAGCSGALRVGRYHSLVADRVPDCLQVVARSEDGAVMALVHRTLPFAAVQFHPESLLSQQGGVGRKLLCNALGLLHEQAEIETEAKVPA